MEKHRVVKIMFYHILKSNLSGAQKNILNILNYLNKEKGVELLFLTNRHNKLTSILEEKNINVLVCEPPPKINTFEKDLVTYNPIKLFKILKNILIYNKDIKKLYLEFNPDIVWCGNIRALLLLYITTRINNAKVIWNIWSEPSGIFFKLVHLVGASLADQIHIEYDQQLKNLMPFHVNLFSKKTKIIFTGIDLPQKKNILTRQTLKIPDKDIIILNASNISPDKAQMDLIKAFHQLLKENKNIYLIICGEPNKDSRNEDEYYENIISYIERYKLNEKIKLIGWQNNMGDILNISDIYVHSSYSESLPVIIREAMGFGLPIIATNVGGTKFLVKDGINGYLYNSGNIVDLKLFMTILINNNEYRKNFGAIGSEIFKNKFLLKNYLINFTSILKS